MTTRTLALGGRLTHAAAWPTTVFTLIEAREQPRVEVLESAWSTSDESMELGQYTDAFGNRGRRLLLPEGESTYAWSATVRVPDEVDEADPTAEQHAPADLPDEALTYLWPSRYVQSDLLAGDAWRLFGSRPRTYEGVQDISDWVHGHVEYRTGSTTSTWTALDSFTQGFGICRDFAHTFVGLCRALNIPARYVSGYLPDLDVPPDPRPADFHAWAEVFLGGRWWTFDPRHNARRKGHVVIGYGRDAADVPLLTAFGSPKLTSLVVTSHEV